MQYVTAAELAEILSVQESTVYRWARERRIPNYRPSQRCVRFNVSEVVDALRQVPAAVSQPGGADATH